MDERRWQQAKELFAEALERSLDEREAFLLAACGADEVLLLELREMLGAHDEAGRFFTDWAATVIEPMPGLVAPGEVLGEFRILREIGRGGMGVVYEAEQLSLHRNVALKLLPSSVTLQPGGPARFRREAELAAKLDHPAIVRVLAAGEERGIPYLAMEWIDGLPLDRLIRAMRSEGLEALSGQRMGTLVASSVRANGSQRPETWTGTHVEATCRIALQVADGLEQARRFGVVHRDVKPANILLRSDGSAVLTDFGLAFMHGLPGLSHSGDVLGTPAYLSPEQARGQRSSIDHRTDQYSLGVTLYELLALRRPHEVESLHEAVQRITTEEPLPLVRLNPRVPEDLATIVHKAIEKDPARRYASTAALAGDLRALLEHRPIAARPPSAIYRLGRFSRRNRALIGGVAAVFVALLTGLVTTTWQAAEARAASKREEKERKAAEHELAVRTQIYEFLHDLLTDFQPGEKDLTVRAMVDRAAERALARAGGDPGVEAEIHSMLAYNYARMGEPARAEPHARKRVEILELSVGKDDPTTLSALSHLAEVVKKQGRAAEAIPIYTRVAEARSAAHGPRNVVAIQARVNLAVCVGDQGRWQEAEAMMIEAAQAYAELGDRGFGWGVLMQNLAWTRFELGRPTEALATLRDALPVLEAGYDEADPMRFQMLNLLARITCATGDSAGGEAVFLDALESSRETMGRTNVLTVDLVDMLTLELEKRGEFARAAAEYEVLARDLRERLPSSAPVLADVLHHWAWDLGQDGELEQAERLAREAASLYVAAASPTPHELRHAAEVIVVTLRSRGAPAAEVVDALRPLVERQLRNVPADHVELITPHVLLGRALLDAGAAAEAERHLREAVRIGELHWGEAPFLELLWVARSRLGEALIELGRADEAEPLLTGAYENLGTEPHELDRKIQIAGRLAQIAGARGDASAAAAWLARTREPAPVPGQ